MASTRLIFIAGCLIIQASRLLATGGNYDEAPPTLDYYIQCLPAKSIAQILNTNAPSTNTEFQSVVDRDQLTKDFEQGASPDLVKKIDRLLVRAREVHSSPVDMNLLQDLVDLAHSTASPAEVSDYLKWRLDHLKWFTGPVDHMPYDDKPALNSDYTLQLDVKISGASPALLPHWLYLKGALYYKNLDDTNSETYFDRVLNEFPESPRAETALFMKARCRLSQSVDNNYDGERDADKTAVREQAKQLFEDYLSKYPQGRYRNDVEGWLGGAAYRSEDFAGALPYFIQQTENKEHPEDFQPAITMIEKCLYHLRDTGSEDIDDIAKHPPVALALAYFAINSAGSATEGSGTDVANIQHWRREVLSKLATQVLAEKKLYRGRLGQNRYLAILAHAASDQGNQEEALKIIRMGSDTEEIDDFAYVKALVYQRAGKLDQAVAGYREFLKKFPSSPLASGVGFRMALALHDLKKDGDALLELASLRGNVLPVYTNTPTTPLYSEDKLPWAGSSIEIDYSGASAPQIDQTMDALLNFAPIHSLATALQGKDKEHEDFRKNLRDVLRERSLAVEDFAGAASFTDLPDERQHLLELAKQVSNAKKSSGPEAAKEMSEIGDYWATSAKLAVVLPLDSANTRGYLFHDDSLAASFLRKTNATVLSFTDLDQALESRDQWTHAISWWTNSVQSAQTNALGAKDLWKAIQAERKIVEISPYTQQRAAETDRMAVVRKEYETLISNYPGSEEAQKYAAFWNFPTESEISKIGVNDPPTLLYRLGRWDQDNLLKALGGNDHEFYYPREVPWKTICEDIANLPEASKSMDAKAFKLKINTLLTSAIPMAQTMPRMPVINFLEDSKQLSEIPSLDPSIRAEYLHCRWNILQNCILTDLGGLEYFHYSSKEAPDISDQSIIKSISELAKKPGSEPIHDFIDFLPVAITANHLTDIPTGLKQDGDEIIDSARNFPLLAIQAEDFLKKYPLSPKREAAMVLRLRGLALSALPRKFWNTLPWPEANSWDGDPDPLFYKQAPFDADAFNKSLKAYYDEFPNGTYPNAVLSYRAYVALMNGQWSDLLDDLLKLRDEKNAPEFRGEIAIQLSELFNKLDDNNLRLPILQEILKRPEARQLLSSYLDAGGIPYLKDYLRERIGKS